MSNQKFFLALTAIAKNENDYLQEFIEFYHHCHKVEHFYIYDNDSEIPLQKTLAENAPHLLKLISFIPFPGLKMQLAAYNHFVENYGHQTHFTCFFDIDEYVVCHKHDTLFDFLHERKNQAGIGINWLFFGPKPHIQKPNSGRLFENYLYSEGFQHDYIKCIVQPKHVKTFLNPHAPQMKPFRFLRNAEGGFIKASPPVSKKYTMDTIQLNHYFTKSMDEYQVKINSVRADIGVKRTETSDMAWLPSFPKKAIVKNDVALRYSQILQNALENGSLIENA
ncbi:glycosyltransferase family 2 protein [Marinilongibacter aquaticus]|uniref:glycosyltransferase family 2 protein n=1 Tax=Marinilongibacter aquaticus TaxID=2975157 RepID=UPI0021BD42E6|nr:glycosyltransferase family 2 protein [Marinilongibacter aquaticus]UBM58972.1 glycosyltransferase family 2 protein [Marinilongibacter aquaticus]